MSPRERAVVVRAGALGDFVLTLPVIRALTARFDVEVVAPARYAPLLAPPARLLPEAALWDAHARATWDLGVAFSAGAADRLREIGIPDVRQATPRPPPGMHAVDHFLGAIAGIVPMGDRVPRLPEPDGPIVRADAPVVIAPGSGGRDKRWPLTTWREVAAAIDAPIVWVRGPVEAEEEGWPEGAVAPELPELVRLAWTCGAWLGPDSGPSHVAAAAGAPVGVVFGPTDPASWAPPSARIFAWNTASVTLAAWATGARSLRNPDGTVAPPAR